MKKYIQTALLCIILPVFVYSQNYIWPTNSSRYLSATFGEYRQGHFHSGIDIKTNYSVGYPVYAVADGYVSRLRTSPFGYGKAVYLQLNDGNTAVYGHLERFSDKMLPILRNEQKKLGRYSVDLSLQANDLPVSQGEIIAYTGDTGTLHPHLHFEIRDRQGKPFNPLLANLRIHDNTVPTIQRVALVPIGLKSRIEGLPVTGIFAASNIGPGRYVVEDTIRIQGPVGVEIQTYDTVKGLSNKYGLYRIRLAVDGLDTFLVQYDEFDFAQTALIDIEKDFQLMTEGAGRFERLWKQDAPQPVPFFRSGGSGVLKFNEGVHRVEIQAEDVNGNLSSLTFHLSAVVFAGGRARMAAQNDTALWVEIPRTESEEFSTFRFSWVDSFATVIRQAITQKIVQTKDSYRIQIAPSIESKAILKIVAGSPSRGVWCSPVFISPHKIPETVKPDVQVRFRHFPNTFLGEIKCATAPSGMIGFYVQKNDHLQPVKLIACSDRHWVTEPLPLSEWERVLVYEIRMGENATIIERESVDFHRLVPARSDGYFSDDSVLSASFGREALYDTLLVWSKASHATPVKYPPVLSPVYSLNPQTQPLFRGAEIRFAFADSSRDIRKIGIYSPGREQYHFVGNLYVDSLRAFVARVKNLGDFCLIEDTVPPRITGAFPHDGGRYSAAKADHLRAGIEDTLSGIADDSAIQVTLDGETVIAEYHGVKDYIRYEIPGPLAPGRHSYSISVRDNAGNTTTTNHTFTIME